MGGPQYIAESDEWSTAGPNIAAPEIMAKIKASLEQEPLILEHRFYRGSSAPARLIFDDYDNLQEYISAHARPGDAFWFWNYSQLCGDNNALVNGKYPDALGRTPRGGAY